MSNAYESAAALRPHHLEPTDLRQLVRSFSLVPAPGTSQEDVDGVMVTGVSVDSGDVAPGELFVGLPGCR